jgi:hypothetical protein
MNRITVTRTIKAPINIVFATVTDIREFSKALPHIIRYEFLSDSKMGVGTKFIETRLMKGRESSTELEITEYMKNVRARIVSNGHGTVWDAEFSVEPDGINTELKVIMDATPYKFLPKLLNLLTVGMVKKSVESDMDIVKAFCEKKANE